MNKMPASISWDRAKEILNNGGVVSFPTDTVYGLAANAFSKKAVQKVYDLKDRDGRKPLVLMCADISSAQALTQPWGKDVQVAAEKHWPGALTLILLRDPKKVSDDITAGGETVGVRIPNNKDLLTLLSSLPFPLAVTSANRSGKKECTKGSDVKKIFGETIDGIVEDDTILQGGVPSTVADVTVEPWKVLRRGPVELVLSD